jgi:hypothetical protein
VRPSRTGSAGRVYSGPGATASSRCRPFVRPTALVCAANRAGGGSREATSDPDGVDRGAGPSPAAHACGGRSARGRGGIARARVPRFRWRSRMERRPSLAQLVRPRTRARARALVRVRLLLGLGLGWLRRRAGRRRAGDGPLVGLPACLRSGVSRVRAVSRLSGLSGLLRVSDGVPGLSAAASTAAWGLPRLAGFAGIRRPWDPATDPGDLPVGAAGATRPIRRGGPARPRGHVGRAAVGWL